MDPSPPPPRSARCALTFFCISAAREDVRTTLAPAGLAPPVCVTRAERGAVEPKQTGEDFRPSQSREAAPRFFFEKRVTTRPKFGRVAPVRIRPRRRRASARARAAGRGGWRGDRVLSVLGASGGAESPRRGTDGKFRNGRVSSVSDQHPLIDRVEGIVTDERPYFLWTTIAKSRSRLFNRTEVSWSRTRRPPPRPPGLRRRRRRRRSRPR